MRRRDLLTSAACFAALAVGPVRAEVPLSQLSSYFNGISTLEARFQQINSDGTRSDGTLYMRRPGRARFEYDPPEQSLVMAGGGKVAIFDGRSNAVSPEQYPLKRTPLWLVLERNVDLDRRDMVIDHFGDDARTTLVAQDPDAPENGRVELVFQNEPLTLAGWNVIDASGAKTTVQLTQIKLGVTLSARLFNIVQEQQSRER